MRSSHNRPFWYRWALWRAIQAACENGPDSPYRNKVHPKNGLRIIRRFEEVNGIPFDPFNSDHRAKTDHSRAHIALLNQLDIMRSWERKEVRG